MHWLHERMWDNWDKVAIYSSEDAITYRELKNPFVMAGAYARETYGIPACIVTVLGLGGIVHTEFTPIQDIRDSLSFGAYIIIQTSGSTGAPKYIIHNLAKLVERNREAKTPYVTMMMLMPDHIGGINTILYTLATGGTLVFPENRLPKHVCELIEKYKVELLPTTPSFLQWLLMLDLHKKYDLSSLKVISFGAEPCPPVLAKKLKEEFPDVKIKQMYGLSETGILRSKTHPDDPSLIKFGDNVEVRDNILWVKTDTTMVGYIKEGELVLVDSNEWLNTEDEVEIVGDYVRILGRVTDIINVGGQKVHPQRVEDVLLQHPSVTNALAYGEPNILLGEVVYADVVTKETVTSKELKAFCKDKLLKFELPIKINFVDSIEISERGKKVR